MLSSVCVVAAANEQGKVESVWVVRGGLCGAGIGWFRSRGGRRVAKRINLVVDGGQRSDLAGHRATLGSAGKYKDLAPH